MASSVAPLPLLDLTTTQVRPEVRIDAIAYEIRTSNDLSLGQYKALERLLPRVGVLLTIETLTQAEDTELSALLDTVCRMGLVAPDAIQDGLGHVNRVLIFKVFTELLTPSVNATRANLVTPAPAVPSTGARSSRVSRASTGATRRRGARASH